MQVLIIGWVWPEPKSSAAGYNMLSLIELLRKQQWQVSFASAAQQTEQMANLQSLDVDCQEIKLNCDSFDDYIKKSAPDIVIFDRFMMEEQYGWRVTKHCPNAMRILNSEDFQSLRQDRQLAYKAKKDFNINEFKQHPSDHLLREIAAIHRCDLNLIISPVELELLKSHFQISESSLQLVPFMFKGKICDDSNHDFGQRQHFISIGNFRHPPNWDAVLYLHDEIWPKILKQFKIKNLPQPQLHIYGAYTPKKASQLHNEKRGFLIKGWAEDAYQVMQQARVCLAPLRFGAGIKGKLADAMLSGTPNVTTSIGTEGMQGSKKQLLAWSGEVADDSDTFAQAATALYNQQTLWQDKQQAGFNIIEQCFNGSEIGSALIAKIESILADLPRHRAQNFIGQMLQHHSLKATQYMSQWIAEKNKSVEKEQ